MATTEGAPDWLEQSPSWFARVAAWALPAEAPDADALEAAALAAAELWVGRALAQAFAAPDELPFAVEAVLRASAADTFDLGAWLGLHSALCAEGLAEDADSLDPSVQAAAEALGCAPRLSALLEAVGAGDVPPSWIGAVGGWLRPAFAEAPLCWIRSVDSEQGTTRATFRRLVGTGYTPLHTVDVDPSLQLDTDQLVFWDGGMMALPLPRWLAHWHSEEHAIRWFHGRASDRRVGYRTASGTVEPRGIPDDAPIFLRDDLRNATPAGPTGLPRPLPSTMSAEPEESARRHHATAPMAQPRMSVPPRSVPSAPPSGDGAPHPYAPEDPLVLRVLTTRYVLRFARLEPGTDLSIGRNSDDANFVLAHHQLSRAHTRVRHRDGVIWVSDLGSTNGTQLGGQDVGRAEVPAAPGDIVAAGPVLMRIEHVPEAQLARMEQVTNLRPAPDRDPLTRLLLPKHLVEHFPDSLQAGFQDGGPATDAPSLWGVLLRIDRLHALHAQLGQASADAAFAITARLVQGYAPDPLSVVRIGYGELLVPMVDVDEAGAREQASILVRRVREQPWEPPLSKITVTAGIGEKQPEEGAGVWVARIRAGLPNPS